MAIRTDRVAQSEQLVLDRIRESIDVTSQLLEGTIAMQVASVAEAIVGAYRSEGKLLLFGNGGSSADAQHLAAEMCGRFLVDRRPLAAIALSDNTAAVTAIGNDYAFEEVFARQVEGLGKAGDVAVGLTTSGRSRNVISGLSSARAKGLVTVGFTGASPGPLLEVADHCICVPSTSVPRIQEAHVLLGHTVCELVEAALFGPGDR